MSQIRHSSVHATCDSLNELDSGEAVRRRSEVVYVWMTPSRYLTNSRVRNPHVGALASLATRSLTRVEPG